MQEARLQLVQGFSFKTFTICKRKLRRMKVLRNYDLSLSTCQIHWKLSFCYKIEAFTCYVIFLLCWSLLSHRNIPIGFYCFFTHCVQECRGRNTWILIIQRYVVHKKALWPYMSKYFFKIYFQNLLLRDMYLSFSQS